MNRNATLASRSVLAMMLTVGATPSIASGSSENAEAVPEIIVTALKRTERLQNVPLSIVAVSGKSLEERQITSASDLQYAVPGLSFTGSGLSSRIAGFSIRGIGTNVFSESIESSVSIIVDGVVMGRQGAGLMDLDDLERVEVLRGPQATLLGKNSSAGAISFVTKAPTREFSANAGVSYGNFDSLKLNGAVSGPIVADKLFLRLSGYSNTRDGFVTNVANGQRLNDINQYGVRFKVLFEATEAVTINLGADYAVYDNACCVATSRTYGAGLQGALLPPPFQVNPVRTSDLASGIVAGPENTKLNADAAVKGLQRTRGVNGQIDFEIGNHVLTSITAYRRWTNYDEADFDLTAQPILSRNAAVIQQSQFTQEIRLVSPAESSFAYVLGAYYFRQKSSEDAQQAGTFGFDLLPPIFPPPFSIFWPTPRGAQLSRRQLSSVSTNNLAGFGELAFKLSDSFRIFAGARILTEEQSVSVVRAANPTGVFLANLIGPAFAPFLASARQRDTAVAYRVGADFRISPGALLFGSYSRGYKGAGFNAELGVSALRRVDPEIPTSIEFGIKGSFLNRKLTINASAFTTTFTNFQAQTLVTDPLTGTNSFVIANAGGLKTQGVEVEANFRPLTGLSLGGSINYLDAKYTKFPNGPCYAGQTAAKGCIPVGPGVSFQDLAGAELNNAPRWRVSLDSRYEFDLGFGAKNRGFIQVAYVWRDKSNSSANNDPNANIRSYGLLDGSVGASINDRLQVSLFGKNLTGKHFDDLIFPQPFDAGGYVNFPSFAARRTYGVSLRVSM